MLYQSPHIVRWMLPQSIHMPSDISLLQYSDQNKNLGRKNKKGKTLETQNWWIIYLESFEGYVHVGQSLQQIHNRIIRLMHKSNRSENNKIKIRKLKNKNTKNFLPNLVRSFKMFLYIKNPGFLFIRQSSTPIFTSTSINGLRSERGLVFFVVFFILFLLITTLIQSRMLITKITAPAARRHVHPLHDSIPPVPQFISIIGIGNGDRRIDELPHIHTGVPQNQSKLVPIHIW